MPEFSLLPRARCQEIFDRVQRFSSADEIEIYLTAGRQALTRFANNIIHQNVEEETEVVSVRALVGQRTARATTNRFDDASIRRVVEEATAIAKLQAPDPDLLPVAAPVAQREVDRFHEPTASASPLFRAQ